MTYHSGPVVSAPSIQIVYYEEDSLESSGQLADMVTALGASSWWSRLSEYSTPATNGTDQTIVAPTVAPAVVVAGTPPATVSDSGLQATLNANITGASPVWGAPTLDAEGYDKTVYVLVYPAGTTVSDDGEYSDQADGFCAYHSSITETIDSKSVSIPYVVLPDAGPPEAGDCGTGPSSGETQVQALDSLATDELADTVTDPVAADRGWYDATSSLEVGEACGYVGDTRIVSSWAQQAVWSNVDDDCAYSVPAPFTALALSPSASSIPAGGTDAFTATGADSDGDLFSDETAVTSLAIAPDGAGTGASCSATGCTATEAGVYTVTGTDGSRTGSAEITITPGPSSALVLSPAGISVVAGTSQTFTSAAVDAHGNATGASTSAATYAITPNGGATGATCTANQCTATTPGTYTVTATDGALTGSTTLVITAAATSGTGTSGSGATGTTGTSGTGGTSGTDTSGTGGTSGTDTSGTGKVVVPPGKVSNVTDTVSGTTAYVKLSCGGNAGATCVLQLTLTANETVGHKVRSVVVGTETITVQAGKKAAIKVPLNSTGKRLLKQKRKLSVKLDVVEKAGGRSTTVITKTLTFR
jgi:hypothetical protein